jgi:hypothetical protein
MMRIRFVCVALTGLALVAGLIAGCTGGSSEDVGEAEGATTSRLKVLSNRTRSFSGAFIQQSMGVRYTFDVTEIDWNSLTARWDAKLDAFAPGAPGAFKDHEGLEVRITLARCPGCYTFDVIDKTSAQPLVRLTFSGEVLSGLTFTGQPAQAILTKVDGQGANGASADGGKADGTASGASCSLVCEGKLIACSEGGTAASCTPARFSTLPRCFYEVKFESKSCAPAPRAGSCSLVCEGNVLGCKAVSSEAECKPSQFSTLPRCPYDVQFKAGASCTSP